MRYLRMLSNASVAACLGASYVLALVLLLNPTLPLDPARLAPLLTTIGLFYVVHLTAICYVLLVLRQLFARELFSPAWISVSELSWMGALATGVGAVLMWRNLTTFEAVVDPATASSLWRSVVVLAAASACAAALTWLRRREPEWRGVWAAALAAVLTMSAAAPVALRGPGADPPGSPPRPDAVLDPPIDNGRTARVAVIAVDAGSLDLITRITAEGRLPSFGRLLDAGAVRHVATLHPTSAEAVWAAVATGKLPQKNGVRSAGTYHLPGRADALQLLPDYCFAHGLVRFGLLAEQPHSPTAFRTRTLWSILSAAGFPVGIVAWPLTQPAPAVRGFLVSDAFHRLAATPSRVDDTSAVYPPDLHAAAIEAMDEAAAAPPVVTAALGAAVEPRHDAPARTDREYDRIAQALARTRPVQVTLTRFQSLDAIGHYFLRYAEPAEFGDVSDEDRRRLGAVLERHYAIVDEAIGRAMAALGPEDLLLVVSGYGMEPLGFGKRVIERLIGDPDVNGTHEAAPDGFLMAYGATVAPGRQGARAAVVDVAPTILYYLGLPIGRDMDGYARTDLFQRSFTAERPIAHIPTYER